MITRKKGAEQALDKIAKAANRNASKRGALNAALTEGRRGQLINQIVGYLERNVSPEQMRYLAHRGGAPSTVKQVPLRKYLFIDSVYTTARDSLGFQMVACTDGVTVDHRDGGTDLIEWWEIVAAAEGELTGEIFNEDFLPATPVTGETSVVKDPAANGNGKAKKAKTTAEGAEDAEKKNGKAKKGNPTSQAAEAATASAGSATLELMTCVLKPNPFQPRHEFDKQELEELATSIKTDGQVQPILVREDPKCHGAYEIADGERRWRAAKIAGVPILAIVRALSDEQMAKLALVANLNRKDLNAVEEAMAFRALLDRKEWHYTQKRIADEFGVSEPQVCNRLRLLELPEAWLKRVVAGELPATHARSLIPYAKYPEILKQMERQLGKDPGDILSLSDWDHSARHQARAASRHMRGSEWIGGRQVKIAFTPTAEQLDELDVFEVKVWNGKEKRALNTKLWDELQAAGEKKRADREAKAEAKRAASGKAPKSSSRSNDYGRDTRSKPSPAAVLKKRLTQWRLDWLSFVIAKRLGQSPKDAAPRAKAAPLKALMTLAVEGPGSSWGFEAEESLEEAMRDDAAPTKNGSPLRASLDVWKLLSGQEPQQLSDLAVRLVRRLFWSDREGAVHGCFDAEIIEGMADDLAIDLAAAWREELGGPLTEQFFVAHNKEQLGDLAKHWGIVIEPANPKAAIVKMLIESSRTKAKLPPSLAPKKPKASKTKAKKKVAVH